MGKEYDVLIIGGGITGAGILRDCALRGIKAILLEKGEFGEATTGGSSRLIQGGIDYLLKDIKETEECAREALYLCRTLPDGFLKRLPFIILYFSKGKMDFHDLGMATYDYFSSLKSGKPHLKLNRKEVQRLVPGLSEEVVGGLTFDEYQVDPLALVNLVIESAKGFGASAYRHFRIVGFVIKNNEIRGASVIDEVTGKQTIIEAGVYVNAAGPWAGEVAGVAGVKVKLRPAKGIHLLLAEQVSPYALSFQSIDARNLVAQPLKGKTLLGNTDDDYYGDLDNVPIIEDEEQYLLEGLERVLPGKSKIPVVKRIAAIRPNLFQWGTNEIKVTKDFLVIDHEKTDGLKRFVTVAGGKMTIFRLMAEKTTDLICQKLGVNNICQTHLYPCLDKPRPSNKEIKKYWQRAKRFPHDRKVAKKVTLLGKIKAFGYFAGFAVFHIVKKVLSKRKSGLEAFYENYK